MKLYICKKRKNYVVLDYDNNRNQVAKFTNETLAKQYVKNEQAKQLQLEHSKIIAKGKRFKFKEEYKKFADTMISLGKDPDVRLSYKGVCGYLGHWNKYINPLMEDLYIDEVARPEFGAFLVKVRKAGGTYKTCLDITTKVKTFLSDAKADGKIIDHPILAFNATKYVPIQPNTDAEKYPIRTRAITREEVTKLYNYLFNLKDKSDYDAIRFALVALFSFFGLRRSELLALRKCHIKLNGDHEQSLPHIKIKSTFDYEEGIKERVKNRGSLRNIVLTPKQLAFLNWWMDYLDKSSPYNQHIVPNTRDSSGPISPKALHKYIWTAFAEVGLATIEYSKKGDYVICVDSPFKGCLTKTFRHFVASSLVSQRHALKMDQNYIMERIGHTRWATTEGIYGNKVVQSEMKKTISKTSKALDF